ncbi:hypothetical protein HHL22_20645 [Hymenobacter sp. RP-2-7]|uniref:Uncharacterized protein n=1 Tax=Hymenobacter polaris TaxID=2682546 RepID=A0A7Y0FP31_9BACT|nr:hypothetical protein [Hymenobacter polaris]NML67617.1 hypothetical protein [Hymenobacter polaris]
MDAKRSRILLLASHAFAMHAALGRLTQKLEAATVEKLAAGCSNDPALASEPEYCPPSAKSLYGAFIPEHDIKHHVAQALKPAGYVGYSNSRSARRRHW